MTLTLYCVTVAVVYLLGLLEGLLIADARRARGGYQPTGKPVDISRAKTPRGGSSVQRGPK